MKTLLLWVLFAPANHLYLEVHHVKPGDGASARAAAQYHKHDASVQVLKYWVDASGGVVYALMSAPDEQAILRSTSRFASEHIYLVTDGPQADTTAGQNYYLDVHKLGAGNVTAAAVAAAHQKDLAVEKKYGVNFINYWVNEKEGVVVCLSQAPDTSAVIQTHREAHGLIPVYIAEVTPGN